MTIDELRDCWEKDCTLDENDLSAEALRIPMLHSKYLNELIQYKLRHTKLQMDVAQLKAVKGRYFRGELTSEELKERGWPQWQYKTLRADIPDMIEADSDIQVLMVRDQYIKTAIYFLESCMTEIKNRNFAIKSALEWQRFRAGN